MTTLCATRFYMEQRGGIPMGDLSAIEVYSMFKKLKRQVPNDVVSFLGMHLEGLCLSEPTRIRFRGWAASSLFPLTREIAQELRRQSAGAALPLTNQEGG